MGNETLGQCDNSDDQITPSDGLGGNFIYGPYSSATSLSRGLSATCKGGGGPISFITESYHGDQVLLDSKCQSFADTIIQILGVLGLQKRVLVEHIRRMNGYPWLRSFMLGALGAQATSFLPMAWIEYHEQLRDHWKVHRLSNQLKIPYAHALGLLSCLWTWAVSNARDGDLGRFREEEISRAATWSGSAKEFLTSLIETGWLDEGNLIHDWDLYGVRLLENLKKRMKRHRNVTVTYHRSEVKKGRVRKGISTSLSTLKEKKECEEKEKTELPHQTIINRFLELKGTERTTLTKEQVSATYKRHSRSALALIAEAGGLEYAKAALGWGARYFDSKNLTWTLDTIAKHLPTFSQYGADDALAAKHGLRRDEVVYARQLATWFKSKTERRNYSESVVNDQKGVPDTELGT
mgnify:CR=1 FL=1